MGRPSPSISGKGSTSIPGTPGLSRKGQPSCRAQSSSAAYIEIDDDDDIDELANDGVSPYFTQPTQIVNRATQPTQIVNRAPQLPSSPLVPDTPRATIEVPASSPFQAESQAKPSDVLIKKSGVASRVGSLMAPAGTSFRPPTMQKPPQKAGGPMGRRDYIDISDDDLLEDYKKQDSSDDDTPTRGDIRPSSFAKNPSFPVSRTGATWFENADISLNDIRDIRLRHLTGQVYKIVQRAVPGITIRACKEALQKDVGWQVSKAVDSLTGRPTKSLSLSKATGALSNNTCSTASTKRAPDDSEYLESTPTSLDTSGSDAPRNNLQTFLKKLPPSANSTKSSSQTSVQLSRTQSSSNSILSSNSIASNTSNNNPHRRRLVQGRKHSSTPSAIFSISSSPTSTITSLTQSRESSPDNSLGMKTGSSAAQAAASKAMPRGRRLMQGRRNKTPDPDSNSESDSLPSVTRLARSRKRQSDAEDLPPMKKSKVDKSEIQSRKRDSDQLELKASDLPTPPNKKTKVDTPKKRKADDELERDEFKEDEVYEISDEDSDPDELVEELVEDLSNVLEYLNTCTVENLGRMIGSTADAQLMNSSRPFKSIADAEKVSRQDKAKSKKKIRMVNVGENIVEKLKSWLQACEAATAVIDECDRRGAEINSIMSTWNLDKNGESKDEAATLARLPIEEKPELMGESIKLKSYQMVGLNWMDLLRRKSYGGILADDMGLGKTCQVISFIAHLVKSEREPDSRPPWPNLIVVPSSTFENWIKEFETFAPGVSVLAYTGSSRRGISPRTAKQHHVVLTTYPQIERQREDLKFLQAIEPYAAIFDEGHKLKNQSTLIYKQMMRVPTEWRLILSGTPVQNNLKELLTILRFIEPGMFDKDKFNALNTIFEAKVPSKDVLNFAALASERVERARVVMAPFILQRRKEEVLALPPKTERLEIVGMHETQKEIYDSIKGKYVLPNGVKKAKKDAHQWMSLRKAAIHHQLFRHHFTDKIVLEMVEILWKHYPAKELGVESKDERYKKRFIDTALDKTDFQLHLDCKYFKRIRHFDVPDRSWEDSPKVQKLLELVRGYMKNGDRVLVFSRFEIVVDILREALHYADIPYCCITGATDTADRFPEIQRFTNNPDIPVFLITTVAGGTGLNLTAANKIILFDQSDNPQEDVQASNRAHRIGQTRPVEIIRFITEKSVECLIYNSCVKKLVLAARVERVWGVEEEEESVEEQCKKRMLLGDEEYKPIDPPEVLEALEAPGASEATQQS
ncbi:SNF2 family N-terminal domain-containing protein [Daldinia loculata]|uniref:SNF2 family N-terminal domain-containing protein n=1 Tax=Daldinia loculata TaxID=103429 RepID=UPI0020C20222|nr:SNF2 family N-terminal domain-containing protein [Daldinia loculata]KAI1648076.1 SNF2 family N-terminal domain-containing protein [Daldinia loculata]